MRLKTASFFLLIFFSLGLILPSPTRANHVDLDAYLYQSRETIDGDPFYCYYSDCIAAEPHVASLKVRARASQTSPPPRSPPLQRGYEPGDPMRGSLFIRIIGPTERTTIVSKNLDENGEFVTDVGLEAGRNTIRIRLEYGTHQEERAYLIESVYIKESCSDVELLQCGDEMALGAELPWRLCNQVVGDNLVNCQKCLNAEGIWTAVGCIPTDPTQMIQTLVRIGLMIGGGVALLIILAGSFVLSTSQGDPKKTSEAKEMITSAVIGLIFIIFSVSILQLIGVQILQIPGFGQ